VLVGDAGEQVEEAERPGGPVSVLFVDREGFVSRVMGADVEVFGAHSSRLLQGSIFSWSTWSPAAVAGVRGALHGQRTTLELSSAQRELELVFEPDGNGCLVVILERPPETPRSAGLWRFVFNQVPGAVWATDRSLRLINVVGRLARGSGFGGKARVGASIKELLENPDPTDPVIASHRAALDGESSTFRYRFGGRTYELYLEPLCDPGDEISGVVGIGVDVSERERVLEERGRSLSLLQATLEAVDDGVLVVSNEGRITTFNRRFLELWQIPSELVNSQDDSALLAFVADQLEDPAGFSSRVRELYDQPEASSSDVLWFKDGRVFERRSRPQFVAGRPVGRVWSFNDVSERERLLRRTQFLCDASRLLASLDVEKALEAVAQLAVPLLGDGCAIDLVLPGGPRRLLALQRQGSRTRGELPSGIWARQPTIQSQGDSSRLQVPLWNRDGLVGALSLVAAPGRRYGEDDLHLAEELAGRVSAALENAQLYRKAEEALRVRDEFLSVAAHEIRGPVTSIHLAAQMLNVHEAAAPQRARATSIILREDRRLSRFVDELLDVGRIRAGRFHFDFEEVDLAQVARDVVARLGPELAASGSSISLTAPSEVPGTWDRMRLEQLIGNLLSNAIKFGGGEPIEVRVAAAEDWAEVEVNDHGIGISEDLQEQIFRPFERGVSSRHYGGLGLGLYIVRQIAEGHGGKVRVRSQPGEGSTFLVRLPRTRA
jgi:signal transduction histidine kinase